MFWPTVGVVLVAAIVHTGTAVTGPVHCTVTLATAPAPAPLEATSVYSLAPATARVSVQLGPFDVQPLQTNDVGLLVHDADIVTVEPVGGVGLLADSVHDGTGAPDCQFTAT